MSNVEDKDPNAPNSNFGGIVVAAALREAHGYITDILKLEEGAPLTSDQLADIIAGALSIGGYVGAHLAAFGILPPANERAQLRIKFPETWQRLVAVHREVQAAIATELDIDSKLYGYTIPAHRRVGGGLALGWTVIIANGAGVEVAHSDGEVRYLETIKAQFATQLGVDEDAITWISDASAAPTQPLRELFTEKAKPPIH